jgi:hypothetical protein
MANNAASGKHQSALISKTGGIGAHGIGGAS